MTGWRFDLPFETFGVCFVAWMCAWGNQVTLHVKAATRTCKAYVEVARYMYMVMMLCGMVTACHFRHGKSQALCEAFKSDVQLNGLVTSVPSPFCSPTLLRRTELCIRCRG